MFNKRNVLLFLTLTTYCTASTSVSAPPRYRIDTIVSKNTLSEDENKRISQYAVGWAGALDTTDTTELFAARQRLIGPLEADAEMSPYVRSIYCSGVMEGIEPLLDPDNTNEMGLVNALQVLSVIGTERTSRVLLNTADSEDEKRDSARLWASIGLGKSFTVGVLPLRRVRSDANLLSNCIIREPSWFVIAEQFSALAAMQQTPNLDTPEREKLGAESLTLQTSSVTSLINSIRKTDGTDERILALSVVLPSIRIQLIDPDLDITARDVSQRALVSPLSDLVTLAVGQAELVKDNEMLFKAYGETINMAGLIVDRELALAGDDRVSLGAYWNDGNTLAISNRVAQWKKNSKN
ncbi:MAG: hypothetical protein H8E86_01560 [Planctomycetes bacterium]|nr:hypothetical protein [Planctomycetota bacterium]